jgi:hypothetical protein
VASAAALAFRTSHARLAPFNPFGVHRRSPPQVKHAAMFKGNVFSWLRLA